MSLKNVRDRSLPLEADVYNASWWDSLFSWWCQLNYIWTSLPVMDGHTWNLTQNWLIRATQSKADSTRGLNKFRGVYARALRLRGYTQKQNYLFFSFFLSKVWGPYPMKKICSKRWRMQDVEEKSEKKKCSNRASAVCLGVNTEHQICSLFIKIV